MPSSPAAAQRPPMRPQGLVAGLATLPFRLFGILCGSLVLSILIEWVGMHLVWPDEGWHHAEEMTEYELHQLSTDFTGSLLIRQPVRTAEQILQWTHGKAFFRTELLERIDTATAPRADGARSGPERFRRLLQTARSSAQPYVMATGYTVLTFLLRLLVLCLMLPLLALAWLVGLVDGLVRRDLRRFGAGRESGFLYHRARASLLPLATLPWVLYLAMPVSLNPLWIVLPGAILVSVAVNLTAGSFKKYL